MHFNIFHKAKKKQERKEEDSIVIPTGYNKLDEMLDGGFRSSRSALISTGPYIQKDQFINNIMYANTKNKTHCVMVSDYEFEPLYKMDPQYSHFFEWGNPNNEFAEKRFKVKDFASLNLLLDYCLLNLEGRIIFIINLLSVYETVEEAVLFTEVLNNKIHLGHGLGIFLTPFDFFLDYLKLFEYNLTIEDRRSKTKISRILNVDKPIIKESVPLKIFDRSSFKIKDTSHLPNVFDGRYTNFTVDVEIKSSEHAKEFAMLLHDALKQLNMVDIEISEADESVWGKSWMKSWLRVTFDTVLRSMDEIVAIYGWLHEFCGSNKAQVKNIYTA